MKIVIAGGSGYLGRIVAKHFLAKGFEVVTLSRKPFVSLPGEKRILWNGEAIGSWQKELENSTLLLNLAGRSVNCRYSKKNRKEILESRIRSTKILGEALAITRCKPRLWLNSSTATIYAHSLENDQTEKSGTLGKGFSVEIAKAWEKEFFSFESLGIRQVALRSAMVFGPGEEGVYGAFSSIVKQGLGGTCAHGAQYVSWIHYRDFLAMLDFIIATESLSGPLNIASPHPLPNQEFMKVLRQSLGVSFGMPCPEWLLEIGAVFKKTETELLLKSRRVVSQRLLEKGFRFTFANLKDAFSDLANSK